MNKKPLNFNFNPEIITTVIQAVAKYHAIIAIVAAASFLIFTVITVNYILSNTADASYAEEQQANTVKTHFDDSTITKINELKSRQEINSLSLPEGRRNPFTE